MIGMIGIGFSNSFREFRDILKSRLTRWPTIESDARIAF